jgi:large subunit ribosomal protein L30
MKTLKITQVKSLIGRPKNQRATVKALGLKRIRHSVFKEDRLEIRGMIRKVQHLVRVESVQEKATKTATGTKSKTG